MISRFERGKHQRDIDYELKIDAQTEKYLEIKQKLTYFFITASIAIIAFLVNFSINHLIEAKPFIFFVIMSSLCGFMAIGLTLLTLNLEHKSHRLHIKYRCERKTWKQLSDKEQKEWNFINDSAAVSFGAAFILLFIQVALAINFFIIFFI